MYRVARSSAGRTYVGNQFGFPDARLSAGWVSGDEHSNADAHIILGARDNADAHIIMLGHRDNAFNLYYIPVDQWGQLHSEPAGDIANRSTGNILNLDRIPIELHSK